MMIRHRSLCFLGLVILIVAHCAQPLQGARSTRHQEKSSTARKDKASTAPAVMLQGRDEKLATHTQPAAKMLATTIAEEIKRADTPNAIRPTRLAVTVTVTGELRERGDGVRLLAERQKSLKDLLDLLRRIREDKNVKTILVRVSAFEAGYATVQELRQAIAELRQRGKRTISVLDDNSQAAYLVAAACDEVVLPPTNSLMLFGIRADAYFFRGLLAKLGVHADFLHIGEYKSYGEMFTEDDFTTPARENMTALVDDVFSQMCDMISSSRGLGRADVEKMLDRGPLTAEEALAAKLVDRIGYADEVQRRIANQGVKIVSADEYAKESKEKPEELNLFTLLTLLSKQQTAERDSKYPQVALLYAVGPIMPGTGGGIDLSNSDQVPADEYLQILEDIEKDPKIKGIILRVSSPGGSALASDLLFRKLVKVGRRKPLITSMGDVAASGGYYLAMAGSKIIANPGSITGSIGVVGGKLNLAGGYEKLGIRKTTIARGRFSTLYSETSDFSPEERAIVQKIMRRTYDDFVAKVAQQRSMTRDQIDRIARGRVWTGAQAKEVGLVDDLGGLNRAITEMKFQLGLKPDERITLIAYPKEMTFLDVLQKAIGGNVSAAILPALPSIATQALGLPTGVTSLGRALAVLFRTEQVATLMPYALILR